jgi:hypothetical protein
MHRSSSVLLAATFAGLIAPSVGLVRLDAPSGHVVAPSISSPKQRSGVPSLTRSEGLLLNKQPLQVQHPCEQAHGRVPLRADYPQPTATFVLCASSVLLYSPLPASFLFLIGPPHNFSIFPSHVCKISCVVCVCVCVCVCKTLYMCVPILIERGRDRQTD